MSRTTQRSRPPMPPPGGWRLMQTAEVLCPDAVALYMQRGEALERTIRMEEHRLRPELMRSPEHRADAWLALQLLDVLRRRPDLKLTGQKLSNSLATREPMQPDVVRAACERDNSDSASLHRWVQLDFRQDVVTTSHDESTYIPASLVEVRIEAAGETAPPAYALGAGHEVKMTYNPARCRAWFRLRIDGWPEDRPPPNRDGCYAAARVYFAGSIDRAEFRNIRNAMVPASWKARGRRSATKTEAR